MVLQVSATKICDLTTYRFIDETSKGNFLSRGCISSSDQEEGDTSPKGTLVTMKNSKADDFYFIFFSILVLSRLFFL